MRFYLKKGLKGAELRDKLKAAGFEEARKDAKTGRLYVETYGDPLDPTAEIPEVPEDIVEFVTHRDVIFRGLRCEGIYLKDTGQEVLVRTHRQIYDPMNGSDIIVDEWQELLVRAPSVKDLIEIYMLVRTGELLPESDWEKEAALAEA